MTQRELLKRVVDVLEGAAVPYMVVGSFASSVQGDPRSTHDIDVVVALTPAGQTALLDAFREPEFFLDKVALREAVRRKHMCNMMDETSGDKVDFWILKDDPYEQECFRRRQKVRALGMELFLPRPEDTILSKLRWSKIGGWSEKQLTDVIRVYEVQRAILDMTYLNHWAAILEVEEGLREVELQAEPPF